MDEKLWRGICEVFFFQDEHLYKAKATANFLAHEGMTEQDANAAVQLVEKIVAVEDHQVELPKFPASTESLLERIGLKASTTTPPQANASANHTTWSASSSLVENLDKIKNDVRETFHKQIASLRYAAFEAEIQKNLTLQQETFIVGQSQGAKDLEGGMLAAYKETSEMASEQRNALDKFLRRDDMTIRPFLQGLHKVLEQQIVASESSPSPEWVIAYWDLDDAALVERGHEFAFAAIHLLLVRLHFRLVSGSMDSSLSFAKETIPAPPNQLRRYVVDPQLSDGRIKRLLQMLSSFSKKAPLSGKIHTTTVGNVANFSLNGFERINIDGAMDASCPQDSLLYPILSHCIIL